MSLGLFSALTTFNSFFVDTYPYGLSLLGLDVSFNSFFVDTFSGGYYFAGVDDTFNSFFVDTEYLYIPFLNKGFPQQLPERRDHENTIGSGY